MVWITQGAIAQRQVERLGTPDKGITMYRRMLLRELARMEQGQDPMNVIRDPAQNVCVRLPCEREKAQRVDGFEVYMRRNHAKYLPVIDEVLDLMRPLTATAAE